MIAVGKFLSLALGAMLFTLCVPLEAQEPQKVPRIGFLFVRTLESQATRVEAFRRGLADLGYVEGQNIGIEWRSGGGKRDRMPELAAELVGLEVDVIVTGGALATAPARNATRTIPIVMTQDNDPVGDGSVASLGRPGKNITGLTNISPALSGKRLELLKQIVPGLSQVAVFGNSNVPGNAQAVKETEDAARALKLKLQYMELQGEADIEGAFKAAANERAQALIILQNIVASTHRKRIAELAAANGLPAILPFTDFVDAGGLISYGPNYPDLFRRAAIYVDRILKGAKPADLPVEHPRRFELVVNLKAAKQIGVTIPDIVLFQADKVIR